MGLAYSETNGREIQEKGKLEDKKLKVGERRREQRARPVRIQNMSRLRRDKAQAISKVQVPEAMNTTNRGNVIMIYEEVSPENGRSFQPNLMAFRRKWTPRILDQLQWHLSD